MAEEDFGLGAVPADDLEEEMDNVDYDDTPGKEVKVTTDGGVVKKILVAGAGWETPEKGDEVTVHYVGTLEDGSKFDSSRDRDDPFNFKLGQGQVIKGWDTGVATMKKGEKSILTCKSEYAYGKQGSPPKIPADATLNFEVELLSWKSIKDLTGDGGVIKTILKEGDGWQKPGEKDEVVVKFSLKAQGSETSIASSSEEGQAFSLTEGYLVRGLPVVVKTMKKGERARALLKPEYGFLDEKDRGNTPTDAILEADLQLLQIRKVEDVTDDGLITKKTIEDSNEYKRPNDGAKVTLRYTAKLEDGMLLEERKEGNELEFVIDEEQVPEHLELAVKKMKKGERALVKVDSTHAYGEAEHQWSMATAPPNSTIFYDVEIVELQNAKEQWEMDASEKVAAANTFKEKGNGAYKGGNLQKAVSLYDKGAALVSGDKDFSDELRSEAKSLKKSCYLNLAAVHLKLKNYKDVCKNAEKVLELDPVNVKALYRRAQAFIGSQDYVEAEQDIKQGLSAESENSELLALYKRLKVLTRQQNKKEAQLYGKMFAALGKGVTEGHNKDAAAGVGKGTNAIVEEADGAGPQSHPIDTPMVSVGEE